MKCDGCTLCCELLPVPWMNSSSNTWCKYCEKDIGCKIFNNVDDRCKSFSCIYNQMKKSNIELRPDKCKVIFEKIADNIIHGSLHPDYDIKDIVKNQINMFLKEGYSVIIESLQFKNPHIYPSKNVLSLNVYKEFKKKVEDKLWR